MKRSISKEFLFNAMADCAWITLEKAYKILRDGRHKSSQAILLLGDLEKEKRVESRRITRGAKGQILREWRRMPYGQD